MSQLFKVLVTIAITLQVSAAPLIQNADYTDDDLMAEESQFFNGGPKLTFGYFGYFQPHGHAGPNFEFSRPAEYNDYDYGHHQHHNHGHHDPHWRHHAQAPPPPPAHRPPPRSYYYPPPSINKKPAFTLPPPAIRPTSQKPGRPTPPSVQPFNHAHVPKQSPSTVAPVVVVPTPPTTQASIPTITEEEAPLDIDLRFG